MTCSEIHPSPFISDLGYTEVAISKSGLVRVRFE